jgi:hypothetical protein
MSPRFWHLLRALPLAALPLAAATNALATMQFQQVFIEQYLADHPDRQFVEYIRCEAKCFSCHQGCEDRKNHNAYGTLLAERLDALADRQNVEKILAALREVAKRPADPSLPSGPTFGDRLSASKLPAGTLEDAKREPGN